jgi:uncharacterized protein YdeI (YjbR/CyaY-like superfamily)
MTLELKVAARMILSARDRIVGQRSAESLVPRASPDRIDSALERVYGGEMSRDPRIDAYIERQADFARPILAHLREAVHAACPEVEEGIKWSMPAFLLRGRIIANMAAFKAHAAFGFWRGRAVVGEERAAQEGMGQFGRLKRVEDLPPPAELDALIRKAAELVRQGPAPRPPRTPRPELPVPDDLRRALETEPKAAETFAAFPPSCRREYVEWVSEAKRPETREKRIAQAVAWMAEGKRRNWKHERC